MSNFLGGNGGFGFLGGGGSGGGGGLPDQTGNAGKFLETDGVTASWEEATGAVLTGYVQSSGTVTDTDTILTAIQKMAGNINSNTIAIAAAQVGNNLFNYYNFR